MDNRLKGQKDPNLEEVLNDDTPLDNDVPAKDPAEDEEPTPNPEPNPEVTPNPEPGEDGEKDTPTGEEDIPVITSEPEVTPTPEKKETDVAKEQRVENIIQNERNNKLLDTIDKAQTVPDPTEDDLKVYAKEKGADYDDLSVFEQSMLKDSWKSQQTMKALNDGVADIKSSRAWAGRVDEFLTKNGSEQAYKGLLGREEKFREYAMEGSHRGADMDLLVSSFLFKNPATATPRKGALPFQTAGGGENPNPKPDVIDDAEEIANLRKTNQKEYQRLVKAGKIKVEL